VFDTPDDYDKLDVMRISVGLRLSWKWLRFVWLVAQLALNAAAIEIGDIVFADVTHGGIYRWNPSEGTPQRLADIALTGANGGIALDAEGQIFAVVNPGGFNPAAGFYRLDESSSQLVPISSERLIVTAARMIVSSDQQSLLVVGESAASQRGLFRVEVATGKQSILTTDFRSTFMGVVPADERPVRIARAPGGKLILLDNAYAHVVEFNEDGTGRRLIAELAFPFLPTGLAVSPEGRIYVSGLNAARKVFEVDRVTGQATGVGDGTLVQQPGDLAWVQGALWVADGRQDAIVRLNPATGEETLWLADYPAVRSMFEFAGGVPAVRPVLAIRRTANGVTMSWNDPAGAWRLESAFRLGPGNAWSPVPTVAPGVTEVEVPVAGFERWFRLARR